MTSTAFYARVEYYSTSTEAGAAERKTSTSGMPAQAETLSQALAQVQKECERHVASVLRMAAADVQKYGPEYGLLSYRFEVASIARNEPQDWAEEDNEED